MKILNDLLLPCSFSSISLREEMEESYETFEEELWPPRADPPPQKPVRQIRKPGGDTHTHTHWIVNDYA